MASTHKSLSRRSRPAAAHASTPRVPADASRAAPHAAGSGGEPAQFSPRRRRPRSRSRCCRCCCRCRWCCCCTTRRAPPSRRRRPRRCWPAATTRPPPPAPLPACGSLPAPALRSRPSTRRTARARGAVRRGAAGRQGSGAAPQRACLRGPALQCPRRPPTSTRAPSRRQACPSCAAQGRIRTRPATARRPPRASARAARSRDAPAPAPRRTRDDAPPPDTAAAPRNRAHASITTMVMIMIMTILMRPNTRLGVVDVDVALRDRAVHLQPVLLPRGARARRSLPRAAVPGRRAQPARPPSERIDTTGGDQGVVERNVLLRGEIKELLNVTC